MPTFCFSGAPRQIAICKRTWEDYRDLWLFYMPKLEKVRLMGTLVSRTVMTQEMVNVLTHEKKRKNPVPCVPFRPSDLLVPSHFNNCKRYLQISDFFSVNAPFYDFHRSQVRIATFQNTFVVQTLLQVAISQ